MTAPPTVTLVTLGCARNDVDAEELAARLEADEWRLVEDGPADVVLVNTCGFVTAAKQESVDTILAAADEGSRVVAVGCLAERYGRELAEALPEAAAVVGFDSYERIGTTLRRVLAGDSVPAHEPVDRRTLLPITPVARTGFAPPPGHGTAIPVTTAASRPGPGADLAVGRGLPTPERAIATGVRLPRDGQVLRRRLGSGPVAALKIASGCDRRCAFCAIPRFRGAFVSRAPADLVAEARWLADQGVRELFCVSENTTSYGKDLGDPRLLESLLPQLAAVPGIERVRLSYLQPAELRPSLIDAIADIPGVVPYFDLSFQHASGLLLRRMRRFGGSESFLDLIARIRAGAPEAGIRSNVIVGFPGESDADVAELEQFLSAAQLDAVGVFGYSDEDGTEAAGLAGKIDPDEIADRVARIADVAELVSAGRAADRKGTHATLLVESADEDGVQGRCEFQGPEDGATVLELGPAAEAGPCAAGPASPPGSLLDVVITGAEGVDLTAMPRSRPEVGYGPFAAVRGSGTGHSTLPFGELRAARQAQGGASSGKGA